MGLFPEGNTSLQAWRCGGCCPSQLASRQGALGLCFADIQGEDSDGRGRDTFSIGTGPLGPYLLVSHGVWDTSTLYWAASLAMMTCSSRWRV